MNPRLLTSAVAIHATACFVALFAVGPRQADASYEFLNNSFINDRSHVTPQQDRDLDSKSRRDTELRKNQPSAGQLGIQKIALSNNINQQWNEAAFDSQLEATSDIYDGSVEENSSGGEVVVAQPLLVH